MGKRFGLRVNIDESTTTWDNAPSGTLLYALKNNNTVKEPSTTEAILSKTEDDYGTSYYFRGNVLNNYVTYSGMCWRIVRVQGDGTIKLALADEKHVCSADVAPNDDGTYSGYNKSNGSSALLNSEYVMVESPRFFSYLEGDWTKVNSEDINVVESGLYYQGSQLETALNSWMNGGEYTYSSWSQQNVVGTFNQKISIENQEKLANNVWCQDFSVYNNAQFKVMEENEQFNDVRTYNAHVRLTENKPSLKCTRPGTINFESKIAMLTADEYFFANTNSHNYLNTNIDGATFDSYAIRGVLTLTPSRIDNAGAFHSDNIFVYGGAALLIGDFEYVIRPVVVLRSDVTVTTNAESTYEPGTQENPYVVS